MNPCCLLSLPTRVLQCPLPLTLSQTELPTILTTIFLTKKSGLGVFSKPSSFCFWFRLLRNIRTQQRDSSSSTSTLFSSGGRGSPRVSSRRRRCPFPLPLLCHSPEEERNKWEQGPIITRWRPPPHRRRRWPTPSRRWPVSSTT